MGGKPQSATLPHDKRRIAAGRCTVALDLTGTQRCVLESGDELMVPGILDCNVPPRHGACLHAYTVTQAVCSGLRRACKASATAWTVGVRSLSLPASVLYELDASPLLWFKWLTNVTKARMQCQYSHTSDQYTWSPAIVGEPIVLHHCAHQVGIQAVQAARG